jgi:hypothetical protein
MEAFDRFRRSARSSPLGIGRSMDLRRRYWTREGPAEQYRLVPQATWEGVRHWRTAGETARAPPCIWLRHDCIPSRT